MDLKIRRAKPYDADILAPLANIAGEGLPLLVWTSLAEPGEDPWDVARARIQGTEAAFSHKNAWVASRHGEVLGCLFAYTQPKRFDPMPEDTPPMFRPMNELEALAPGTGFVNILATVEEARGQGIGSRLLEHAEEHYRGPNGMSLIVADANLSARRLYERHGYVEAARRKAVKNGWDNPTEELLLMLKP